MTSEQVVESRDRRIGKGIVVAMSCKIYYFANEKETYKVQSETKPDVFYIVKFMDGTPVWCSCKDWENRSKTNPLHICKHQRAIVLADQYGLIKDEEDDDDIEINDEAREATAEDTIKAMEFEYQRDDYTF